MKRFLAVVLCLSMLLSAGSVFATEKIETPEKMYIFVKAGATGGDGSKDKPLGTIVEARDKIREIKAAGKYPKGGIVVYFREGQYKIDAGMHLKGEQDSGTDEGPIVYRSYMEEQVTFVGGVELPVSKFRAVTDADAPGRFNKTAMKNIKVINLYDEGITDLGENRYFGAGVGYMQSPMAKFKENGIILPTTQPPEVFFGDDVGDIARYPNGGEWTRTGKIIQKGDETQMWSDTFQTYSTFVPYEKRTYPPKPSIYEVTNDVHERMKLWKDEDEVWVYGYFGENWSDISLKVANIDYTNGVITTELPSPKPIKTNMRYYIYNVLGELDAPGEYFIDRTTGNLYIYPKDLNGTVTFSSLNSMFLFLTDVDNVSFKSLSWKGSRATAIYAYGCDNVNFEHCMISLVAGAGISALNLTNCSIKSCHIYKTGTNAIYLGANANEARGYVRTEADEQIKHQNNIIENCDLHDFGRINASYTYAIAFGGGAGCIVRNNELHGGDQSCISYDCADLIVEYNEFYDLCRTADDMGLNYNGYTKRRRGQVFRHNYFHDIQSSSTSGTSISMVYADDTMDGVTVESNIFENIGGKNMIFYSNGGRAHTVKNNVVINADRFVHFNNHGTDDHGGKYTVSRYDFMKYIDNPAYAKYPHFTELSEKVEDYLPARYNTVYNNVLIGVNQENTSKGLVEEENDIRPSLVLDKGSDPGFEDVKNRNYVLRDDSLIYRYFPDFEAPDFKNMGIYTSTLKILLGDETTSFLNGSPKTYIGFEADEINKRHDAYPVIKNGVTYLPIRYVAERVGAAIEYDDKTAEISIGVGMVPVIIKPSEYFTINGSALVPADKIEEIFETTVKTFDNGIILMGNNIRITEEKDHVKLLEELARRLYNE